MRVATWTAALWVVVLLSVPLAPAADPAPADATRAQEGPVVVVSHGRVDISAKETPVPDLLARMGQEAGFAVFGRVVDPHPVTVEFREVPIRLAVRRLIGGQSFTMRYGADGELRCITLRSAPAETPQVVERPENFETVLKRHPKIRVDGQLERQFGRSEVDVTRLLQVVRIQPAGPLRSEAMERFLDVVEGDRELLRGLREMTSEQLARFARRQGGRNADDLARFLSTEAKDANVRQRAASALRTLKRRS